MRGPLVGPIGKLRLCSGLRNCNFALHLSHRAQSIKSAAAASRRHTPQGRLCYSKHKQLKLQLVHMMII